VTRRSHHPSSKTRCRNFRILSTPSYVPGRSRSRPRQ